MEKYQTLRTIGTGASAQVIQAKNRLTNQIVLIKKVTDLNNIERKKLFQVECDCFKIIQENKERCSSQISEENKEMKRSLSRIVDVIDSIEDTNESVGKIIMPFIENSQSLDQYLDSESNLCEIKKLRIFLQILDGVRILHKLGIYHRDLKLQNIIFCNNDMSIYIIDFGIAQIANKKQEIEGINRNSLERKQEQSIQLGSKFNLSPQCLQKSLTSSGEKRDIWQLGVILYYMLNNTYPFGKSGHDKRMKDFFSQLQTDPNTIRIPPNTSTAARTCLESSLKYREEDRISVQIMYETLQKQLEHVFNPRISSLFPKKNSVSDFRKTLVSGTKINQILMDLVDNTDALKNPSEPHLSEWCSISYKELALIYTEFFLKPNTEIVFDRYVEFMHPIKLSIAKILFFLKLLSKTFKANDDPQKQQNISESKLLEKTINPWVQSPNFEAIMMNQTKLVLPFMLNPSQFMQEVKNNLDLNSQEVIDFYNGFDDDDDEVEELKFYEHLEVFTEKLIPEFTSHIRNINTPYTFRFMQTLYNLETLSSILKSLN